MLAALSGMLCGARCHPECSAPELSVPAEVTRLETIGEACPGSRDDELCHALRLAVSAGDPEVARSHFAEARARVGAMVAADRAAAIADAAVRWYLRERVMALLVWYDAATGGAETLARHFPLYAAGTFRMAEVGLPPSAPACQRGEAVVVIFPGVVRTLDRTEFEPQLDALREVLPCIHWKRAETLTFVTPQENAAAGCTALREARDEFGDLPVHLVGYSQGSRNALQTLLTCPEEAQRVHTLVTLNSAARGSPVADAASLLEEEPDLSIAGLGRVRIALALGIPTCDGDLLGRWLAAEGFDGDLAAFFAQRVHGLRSLSTYAAAEFWGDAAAALPEGVLALTFRSIITRPKQNLPDSNCPLFLLGRRASLERPDNDMQVRLVNQYLGGAFAETEVIEPVAEGNHWQWELNPGDVPGFIMPDEMLEGIPRAALFQAHFAALDEVGLLGDTRPGHAPPADLRR